MQPEEQDPEERRVVRHQLRTLLENTKRNQQELVTDKEGLMNTLKEGDNLFKRVKNPREAVIDSQLMVLVSEITKQRAQALHTNLVVFQPVEYAKKLIRHVNGDTLAEAECGITEEGWNKLGLAIQSFFQRSPPFKPLLGTFARGPPIPKVKEKKNLNRIKDDLTNKESTVPKQLKDFSETLKTENTTEEVEKMHSILKKLYAQQDHQPLCYFEFIMNPESFGQTIENLFYASFLVKDGHARIFLDADKLPVIEPVERTEGAESINNRRHQVVLSLTQKQWKEIIRDFHIGSPPLIPTRDPMRDTTNNQDSPEAGPSTKKKR